MKLTQLLKPTESVSSVSDTRLVPVCLCFTSRISWDRELISIFRIKGFICHNITCSVAENVNLQIMVIIYQIPFLGRLSCGYDVSYFFVFPWREMKNPHIHNIDAQSNQINPYILLITSP